MSNKTGRLTKIEKFYIANNLDKDLETLSKDLNRTKASVKKHVESLQDTGHTTTTRDNEETQSVSDLMGRKEDRGVTIMTQAASQVADSTRGNRLNVAGNQDSIHIIKKND
jgi:hypothetical protein